MVHILVYMVICKYWMAFDGIALSLKINHVMLIQLVTVVATLLVSVVLVLFEYFIFNPVRSRLFDKRLPAVNMEAS